MKSIRWKIMLTCFLLVYVTVYWLNGYAIKAFSRFTSHAQEEEMVSQATMLGEHYKTMVLESGDGAARSGERFAEVVKTYGEKLQSRLQVLSPEGSVLFDSGEPSMVGENLADRKGIASAIAGRYDAEWKLTPDGKKVYYFVPIRIVHDGKLVGIAYASHHTGQITKAIHIMQKNQRLAMVIALLCAGIVSAVLAQTMTGRLRRLTRATGEYAQGAATLDLPVRGRDEIATLSLSVQDMAAEIDKRNRYNRDFVSTVMHELKTPVTAIKGAVELLEEGAVEDPKAREKFLGNIRFEAERLNRMIAELGEMTKIDVDSLRGQLRPLDYGGCVREILDRLMPTFEDEAHADLRVSIPDETMEVMLVPGRIEQVVSNLLENAFRYTPPSGRVELTVRREGEQVLTSVQDTGPGIPEDQLDKVFDRFYTTEPKNAPKDYGSGLGLAIARTIVESHRGRIHAEHVAGSGALLVFSLPIARG